MGAALYIREKAEEGMRCAQADDVSAAAEPSETQEEADPGRRWDGGTFAGSLAVACRRRADCSTVASVLCSDYHKQAEVRRGRDMIRSGRWRFHRAKRAADKRQVR